MLAGEALYETPLRLVALDLLGALQRLQGSYCLAKAAVGQRLLHSGCQIGRAKRFFEDVVGGAWPLQSLELGVNVQRTRHDDDRYVRGSFFQLRKEVRSPLASGK